MSARCVVFPQDRSERWVLVPGVASARQIDIRNESDAPIECHLRVEQPQSASASPAVLTIQPRHARTADIIFLANWSLDQGNALVVSLRDPNGEQLAVFTHELVAAENSDCAVNLDVKGPILVGDTLAGFKLWFSIASRSATARRFEVDFMPHPSLRFPERKTVLLGPGEATAFEVPVEWNRAVRDLHWWNHPLVIEAFVPVSRGRRTATLSWDVIERKLDKYVDEDDKVARVVAVAAPEADSSSYLHKTPGQLKYTELLELKKLEQAVVGGGHVRTPTKAAAESSAPAGHRRVPIAPLVTTGIALVALGVGAFFYLRPPVAHPATAPIHVTPPELATPVLTIRAPAAKQLVVAGPVAKPVWTSVAVASRTTVAAVDSSREAVAAATAAAPPKTVALAPHHAPQALPTIDRNAVVELSGVDAAYTSGGHAVSVAWTGSAQASATVELLDVRGKIIASRTIRGDRSTATVRLPRGYRGSVNVQVIALGHHGERVVQSASLTPGG